MPTRKQRRRRDKERRHEYEEVLVYPDGREVPVAELDEEDEEPGPAPKAGRADGPPASRDAARAAPRKATSTARGGRTVQPPSWRRVLKRTLIFAPIMFLLVTVTSGGDTSSSARVFLTVQLVLLFIPFAYLMDSVAYRMYRKRQQKAGSSASAKRRARG
jgi:hypothetical protein